MNKRISAEQMTNEILPNAKDVLIENLKITIRSGSFKGKELIFVEFVKFMNVNRSIIETLILKQKKEGFNYGKIKDVSFTFE
jgi:hypothetical protein